jgi:imidazolonepropionase
VAHKPLAMQRKILLRGARQLLTLRGAQGPRFGSQMRDVGLIDDGALLIVDGIIQDVGTSRRVDNLAAARDAIEVSAAGRVVVPGFVDCRTSLVSGPPLLSEFETRVSGGGGPTEDEEVLIRAVRASSRPRLELLARKMLREFIRHGTTTLDAHTGLGLNDKTELKILRALNAARGRPLGVETTFFGASRRPADFDGSETDYLRGLVTTTFAKIQRFKLSETVDVRIGPGGFGVDAARTYLRQAKAAGFSVKVTASEIEPDGGVQLAIEAGALSVDHLEMIREHDTRLIADSNVVATLLPGASYHRQRSEYAPAGALMDAGAAVALATGYSSDRCPTCSMPAILSLACTQMKMSPAAAIAAATINAAWAMGLGEQIGSLERGKQADLVMLNVADYREIPYHFGMNLVAMTMKGGDVIYPRMEFPWSS